MSAVATPALDADVSCRSVPIALLGTGTVGLAFARRVERLVAARREALVVRFVANSRASLRSEAGLAAADAVASLRARPRALRDARPPEIPAGAIVVDATACPAIAATHAHWLARGHAVVTANKLGLAGPLARYLEIRAAGERYGDSATVGAGLPLLRTLRALRAGGDSVDAIAGVLSGTLAWLFDGYDALEGFGARVLRARALGYAEPDPRVDLSGEDARRKLLILARSAGLALEPGHVAVESLVPDALREVDLATFIARAGELDTPLARRFRAASDEGRVLRHVARFDGDGARVGLEALEPADPLAQGRGCDNRVAMYSCRYRERPLVIEGPGAGAEVTAAALLDDVLRIAARRDAEG